MLKAKLVEFDENRFPPYCGYSKQFGMLKLTLMENSKRLNFGDTIFIYQMCPRELMEFDVGLYENNKTYKLYLGKRVRKNKIQSLKDFSYARYKNKDNENFYNGRIKK